MIQIRTMLPALMVLVFSCTEQKNTEISKIIDSMDKQASSYYYPGRDILIDSISPNLENNESNSYCTDSLYRLMYIANQKQLPNGNYSKAIAYFLNGQIFKIDCSIYSTEKNVTQNSATFYYLKDTVEKYGDPGNEIENMKQSFTDLYKEYMLHRPRRYFVK